MWPRPGVGYVRLVTETETETPAWDLYRNSRDRFIALIRSLDDEQTALTVPITSGWTVAQVLAHVCGLNGDLAAGAREGLGTDERTRNQVESRAGLTVEQICEEWLGHEPTVGQIMTETPELGERLGADLIVHFHDVQHALGLPIDRDDEATRRGGRIYGSRMVDVYAESVNVTLNLDLGAAGRFEPADPPAGAIELTLRTTAYDFLRSVTGRRSRAEVQALDWSGDPAPLLDGFSPYGPLRTEDAGF